MTFTPSIDSASRILHEYAELQRASDKLVLTMLEMGVNPTDIRQLISVQREMLGGALTLAVGQLDLIRIFDRDSRIPVAAGSAVRRDAPTPVMDDDSDHGHDEMGLP